MRKPYRPSAREMNLIKIEKKIEKRLMEKGLMGWQLRNPQGTTIESKNYQKLELDIAYLLEVSIQKQLLPLVDSLERIEKLNEALGIGKWYHLDYSYEIEFYVGTGKTNIKTTANRKKESEEDKHWVECFCSCLEKMHYISEAVEIRMTSAFSEEEAALKIKAIRASLLSSLKNQMEILENYFQDFLVDLKKEIELELEQHNQKWLETINN